MNARLQLVALCEREMPLLVSEFTVAAGCKNILRYEGKEGIQGLLAGLWSLPESATLEFLQATGLEKSLWGKCSNALVTVLNRRIRPLIAEELADEKDLLGQCNALLDRELAQAVERITRSVGVEYSMALKENRDELQASLEEIRAMNEELRTANEEIQTSLEEVDGLRNRLEMMMRYASDAIFIIDSANYQIREANIQASALIGYPAGEIKGNNFVRFCPAYLLPKLMERFEALRTGKHMVFDDIPIINHELKEVPVEISAVQIKVNLDTFFYFSLRDIAERKVAEKALKRAKEDWENTFDSITDLVMLLDKDHRIVRVNQTAALALNTTKETITGQKCHEVIHGLSRPIKDCPLGVTMNHLIPHSREITEPRLKGTFICSTSPILDQENNLVGYTHLLKDITERKKAEEELANQRRLQQTILEHIPDLIVLKDRSSVYQAVNPAFCKFVGRSAEEIIGHTDYDLFPREEAEKYRSEDSRIMENDEAYLGEECVTGIDGKNWLYVSKTPVRDANEQIVGILCSVRDITKLKESEDALKRARAELDQIFQTAADGMRVVDKNFNIIRVNDTFAAMVDLDRKDILGKKCYDIFKGDRCHTPDCPLTRILKDGKMIEHESKKRRSDGTETSCIVMAKAFKGPEGDVIGIVEDFRDITERQKLEAQIRQAQKMESVGTLAGGIAHDFNNLLGGMLGYASIVKMALDPLDRNYKYIELIEKAGERAAELTNQLLAFSRKGKYQIKPVDLNRAIRSVANLLERTIDKNIRIRCSFFENLPMVEGDPGQLEQIIMNLCVNAVDAMPGGGYLDLKTRMVAIDEECCVPRAEMVPDEYILLEVKDAGIGMDKETVAKIFEPFFTTKEVGKGTGLGMSMVYGIVNNHGGYIDVESEPGKGTTFKIYLPAISSKKLEVVEKESGEGAIAKGTGMIFVVDDEEIIRAMLKDMLESLGYKVGMAANGTEAIDLYSKHGSTIDLVIIDMIMPGLDGKETYLRLKELNPDVKVILASGYSHDTRAQEIINEGVCDFVYKPFTVGELSRKIRHILNDE